MSSEDVEHEVVNRDVPMPEDFEGTEELLSSVLTPERYQKIAEHDNLDREYDELDAFEMARYTVRMIRGEYEDVTDFEYGDTHANLGELQQLLEAVSGRPASGRLAFEETVEEPGQFSEEDAERIQGLLGAEGNAEQRKTGGHDYSAGAERGYLDLRAEYEEGGMEMHGEAPVDRTEEEQPDFEEW